MKPVALAAGSASVAAVGLTLWSSTARHRVEQPDYQVVTEEEGFEVRHYAAAVAAVTEVEGDFDAAAGEGFRRLAGYIFGRNGHGQHIAMTSPVVRERRGEKAAASSLGGTQHTPMGWQMCLAMPSRYGYGELPRPDDPRVRLETVRSRDYAAVRYSGRATESRAEQKKAELLAALGRSPWRAGGEPLVATYDPPWALPFLRRNEVLVPVTRAGA